MTQLRPQDQGFTATLEERKIFLQGKILLLLGSYVAPGVMFSNAFGSIAT
jgi:hypothetical protein